MTTITDTTTTARPLADVVDDYFALWNETDPARRLVLAAAAFAPDGRHVDPLADVAGADAVTAMIAGVQERFPAHQVVRTSGLDVHHDAVRYTWQLEAPDGSIVVTALDVVQLAEDGRFSSVTAFFHDVPALDAEGR